MGNHLIKVSDEGVLMDGTMLRNPSAVYAGAVGSVFLNIFRTLEPLTSEECTHLEVDLEQRAIRAMKEERELASVPLPQGSCCSDAELAFVALVERYMKNCAWD